MTAAARDPRLLLPLGDQLPARALVDELAGAPGVIRFGGPAASWAPLERLGPSERRVVSRFTREAVALVIAVRPPGGGSLPDWIKECVDLVASDPSVATRWERAFLRSPQASMAVTMLSRCRGEDVLDGLIAESATYSMLQAGEEFRQWLATRAPRRSSDDDAPRVRAETIDGARWVTLARPARHNALDRRLRDELHAELNARRHEPAMSIVLRGEGPSFCSGGDLEEFGTFESPAAAHSLRLHRSLALLFTELAPRTVVGLHGACLGAGIELPAFAERVVAADDARIGLPEGGLGLVPGAGGTVSIPRRAGSSKLLELLFADEPIDAQTALAWGLVDEVVPSRDLERRLSEEVGAARRPTLAGRRGAA
jgi:enoyl-CoA hydratase/carnithine racemase